MEITIEKEFAYVVFVAIASNFLVMWMGIKVGGARKKYGVKVGRSNATLRNGKSMSCNSGDSSEHAINTYL